MRRMAMRNAQAKKAVEENTMDALVEEFCHLKKTLSPDKYFRVLDEFVDHARKTIAEVPDPARRETLRYRRVIELAVDMVCTPNA
jgi:hypothetical protein